MILVPAAPILPPSIVLSLNVKVESKSIDVPDVPDCPDVPDSPDVPDVPDSPVREKETV